MATTKLTLNIDIKLHKKLKAMAFFKETTMTEIILKEIKKAVIKYGKTKGSQT